VGIRDRAAKMAKSASEAAERAAARAEAELDNRGVDVRGTAKNAVEAAGRAASAARTELDARGVSLEGLVDAASSGVRGRNGKVKRRKVAKWLLHPAGAGRAVVSSVGQELLRQRRSHAESTADLRVEPSMFDDAFFIQLIDWAVESTGVDDEDNRALAVDHLASNGLDAYASSTLDAPSYADYLHQAGDGPIDLTSRAAALLEGRPHLATGLLERLEQSCGGFATSERA
jgi:hypothetical protein